MSEETKDQETTAAVETAAPGKIEPITLELEDLTEEGKKKTEKALGRQIPDVAYTVLSQESRPGSLVALRLETSREAYDAEQTRLLNDLRKEAVLPGFRKGKAPIALLLKRLGEEAKRDTIRALAVNALRQENAKQAFKLISKPQVVDFTLPEAGAVGFEVECEVEPAVEVKQYKGLSVEVETQAVTDEMVEQRLDGLRRQNAVVETAGPEATVGPDDAIVVDVEVKNARGERMDNLCKENQFMYAYSRELPEAVASQLAGKKAGESVSADVEHASTNRRGETVTHTDAYTVTVREIKVNKLPNLDDEFAKDLGEYESLEDLRAKTRKELEENEEQRQRGAALQALYRKLSEVNPVDAPKSLEAQQAYRLIMDDQQQLARMGLRLEQVIQDADKYLADQRANAAEMIKVRLILDKIAETEKLEVTDADVDAEIETMAEKTGRKPLAIRARLEAQKQLDQFRAGIAQRKLGDFLLANNTVTQVEPKPAEEAATEEENVSDAEPVEADAKPKRTRKKKTEETEG